MNQPNMANKKMGKAMLTIGWIIFFVMLTYFFGNWEEAKINPNQELNSTTLNGVAEVVLEQNRQGHYVLNTEVNGQTLTFLLDTGATQVVVTEAQAREAGLHSGRSHYVSTANGNIQVYSTTIDHLQIGDIHLYNVPASINPHMDGYGLLGMSALTNLEWSQRGEQLTLRSF